MLQQHLEGPRETRTSGPIADPTSWAIKGITTSACANTGVAHVRGNGDGTVYAVHGDFSSRKRILQAKQGSLSGQEATKEAGSGPVRLCRRQWDFLPAGIRRSRATTEQSTREGTNT